MATAVLTNTPTVIDNAEAITNWGGDTFVLDPDVKIQGSNSVSCVQSSSGINDAYVTGTWDFSGTGIGDQHLRLWINTTNSVYMHTEANDGMQVFLYDGTNTAYWTVGGGDTYAGGWKQFVVDTSSTPTSGTVNKATITRIGFRINAASKPKNVINWWADAWTFGDGYTITGGTSGDEIDWSHVAALDLLSAYGIVTRIDDIYFFAGDVTVGSGATTTFFKSGQKVQFKDLPVLSTLYGVTFEGSACNVDISGGSYGAAGTQNYLFDASDTNLNSFSMTGVQFAKANSVLFEAGSSITNCVFDSCGQVDPSTSTFTGHIFSNSVDTGGAMLWPSDDTTCHTLQFLICDNDVEYDAVSDSTPNFYNIVHDDNAGDYDVNNTSGATVTIPLTGTSNGNSYNPGGNIVNFQASVTLTFTVTDDDTGLPIQYARINIVNATTFVELYQIETNVSGIATQAHTYAGEVDIEGWVRQMDNVGDDYTPKDFAGTIKSTGFDANITLIKL